MMYALGSSIVTLRAGRVIALASNAPADRVRALQLIGYSEDIARVFGGGAERAAVLFDPPSPSDPYPSDGPGDPIPGDIGYPEDE